MSTRFVIFVEIAEELISVRSNPFDIKLAVWDLSEDLFLGEGLCDYYMATVWKWTPDGILADSPLMRNCPDDVDNERVLEVAKSWQMGWLLGNELITGIANLEHAKMSEASIFFGKLLELLFEKFAPERIRVLMAVIH
ncbi:MAG: hypothetical protein ABL888_05760 [Pirellulaceae bacterium]